MTSDPFSTDKVNQKSSQKLSFSGSGFASYAYIQVGVKQPFKSLAYNYELKNMKAEVNTEVLTSV